MTLIHPQIMRFFGALLVLGSASGCMGLGEGPRVRHDLDGSPTKVYTASMIECPEAEAANQANLQRRDSGRPELDPVACAGRDRARGVVVIELEVTGNMAGPDRLSQSFALGPQCCQFDENEWKRFLWDRRIRESFERAGYVVPRCPSSDWDRRTLDVLQKSKSLDRIETLRWAIGTSTCDAPDVFSTVRINATESANFAAAIVTGLTFGVIPTPAINERYVFDVQLIDAVSGATTEYQSKGALQGWIGLLLFPATPFLWPFSEAGDVRMGLMHELVTNVESLQ